MNFLEKENVLSDLLLEKIIVISLHQKGGLLNRCFSMIQTFFLSFQNILP